jgi:hypothetical protein
VTKVWDVIHKGDVVAMESAIRRSVDVDRPPSEKVAVHTHQRNESTGGLNSRGLALGPNQERDMPWMLG